MTAYYVSNTGSDSNNGLSEVNAFATPGYACGQATAYGDTIYIKAGTYNCTTTTNNVAGGYLAPAQGVNIVGYEVTIDDDCPTNNRPLINNNGNDSGAGMITGPTQDYEQDPVYYRNIHLDAYSDGSTHNWSCYKGSGNDWPLVMVNCKFSNGWWAGVEPGNSTGVQLRRCHLYKSPQYAYKAEGCLFEEATFNQQDSSVTNCIFKNCGIHHRIPVIANLASCSSDTTSNCIFYNEPAYKTTQPTPIVNVNDFHGSKEINNCIFWGYGHLPWYRSNTHSLLGLQSMQNIAYGDIDDPLMANPPYGITYPFSGIDPLIHGNVFEIFEDPFVDAANNDFRLKKSGAGLQLRNNFVERDLP